jgi:hypothetical protein
VQADGADAEALVYLYASCDRKASYCELVADDAVFTDRFTGERTRPPVQRRRDFAELTAANELDITAVSPQMRDRYGPAARPVHPLAAVALRIRVGALPRRAGVTTDKLAGGGARKTQWTPPKAGS